MNMKKIKQQLKELWWKILKDIFIYKDPFDPHYENNLKRREK